MASHGEKVLAIEWLAIMAIQTGDAIYEKSAGKTQGAGFLPQPQRYFATMIVFFFLAAASAFSDRFGRTAAAFGGLAAIAIGLAVPKGASSSPLVGFTKWLASMAASPPQTVSAGTPTQGGIGGTGLYGQSAGTGAGTILGPGTIAGAGPTQVYPQGAPNPVY